MSLLAKGFPSALSELSNVPEPAEPGLVFGLYALLRVAGTGIDYCETEVLSGHAGQFLYHRDHPECTDLSFAPPVDTLFRALGVSWKEVTPSGPVTAFSVIKDWISQGYPVLARLREPLLIYGYDQSGPDHFLMMARLANHLDHEKLSLSDCDAHYWRYPVDEGNTLLRIEEAPHTIPNMMDLVRLAARRTVRVWHLAELAGCASGMEAYQLLARDLADPDVDFIPEPQSAWMGKALWSQWTARAASANFFERVAPRFGGSERAALAKASFCYSQCVESWQNWAKYLGPTWDRVQEGFPKSYPGEFAARWRNRERRMSASRCVERAAEWEGKAVSELVKVLK